ncbi:unnamed protein product [Prorocentrum cordatum]|uniref:Mei2-like C-terminal RNA recognition motif domain-containing protein n=1 Tax=Prorocentrum cordatum TaxID=2364126 RepID=A0ABN9QK18_9DINO|nr:unnamed protein product [Polarella glacialis]
MLMLLVCSSASSRASAFVPRSSQVARAPAWAVESEGGPVLGAPSQALAQSPAVTTAMLRNLPCDFTRSDLLDILDREGFAGADGYDFVYVPIDFKRKLCKGYSFVNMVAAEHLQRLVKVFNGYNGWSGSSTKVCQASMSHTQGLTANIERYRNSPVLCDAVPDIFKPALFMGKRQVPFPEPTRKFSQVIQHF